MVAVKDDNVERSKSLNKPIKIKEVVTLLPDS